MRRLGTLSTILVALSAAAVTPTFAQVPGTAPDNTAPAKTAPDGNVSAVGRKMPPAAGRTPSAGTATDNRAADSKAPGAKAPDTKAADAKKAATEAEMLKAQKAAEARNKAWDSKMRKTMGSICSGC